MSDYYPIVYVRGYSGTQSAVEETVDDPTYGFNAGSTHVRLSENGKADFFMFVSPFARLFRDHNYQDVIDGAVQRVPPTCTYPERTIWIYRYYDPTSKTFDRPGGRRLSIEEAANGLRDFIADTVLCEVNTAKKQLVGPNGTFVETKKVYLVAHSMGGLVCRCLLQKIYGPGEAPQRVDKLFTYGTPHGGIHFEIAGGRLLEKLRDMIGLNDSDNFGQQKMYSFLTRKPNLLVPDDFDPRVSPAEAFDPKRIFCVVGTDAADYAVAAGLSRTAVGPQSDGLVQIESAYVKDSSRAYIHRCHSGRYGMVNSEEGYQNLQRFLFGDVRVEAYLTGFTLDFSENQDPKKPDVSYFVETQVSTRGLPILMHERTLQHFCAEAIDETTYKERYTGTKKGLPLFTNFLLQNRAIQGKMRYMIHIALFKQCYKDGFLLFEEHLERLPLWSDFLILELTAHPQEQGGYDACYCWASESRTPDHGMKPGPSPDQAGSKDSAFFRAALTGAKAAEFFGRGAAIEFESSVWN